MKIVHTSDPQPPSRISGLYMGDAYTGKTYAMCTWPNPLLVSFDPHTDTARKFKDITILEVPTWRDFEYEVMPHIKNRDLSKWLGRKVDTVCVDTITMGAQRCGEEIMGVRDKMRIQDYGTLLSKLTTAVIDCTDTCQEQPNRESYHVLFSAHMRDIYQSIGDERVRVSIRPAIDSEFKNLLPRLTAFAFLCETELEPVTEPNKTAYMRTKYVVRTTPPSKLYVCGDRIGGGRFNTLPPTIGGTYPELAAAWGLNDDEGKPR